MRCIRLFFHGFKTSSNSPLPTPTALLRAHETATLTVLYLHNNPSVICLRFPLAFLLIVSLRYLRLQQPAMLRSRSTSRALKVLAESRSPSQRLFTSSTKASTITARRNKPVNARNQTTSAAANAPPAEVRPTPSPAFNPAVKEHVQPLVGGQKSNMDDSFIGKTGGEIFHEMMLRHGVKHIFGYPGGAILPVFDAIHNSPHFDFVLPRHEQGAGHMAEGYARASGKPGVVLVTSGPGATNVVTPMADALADGTPMVVFCGQVVTSAIGSDAFQEADVIGISRSCTKWNVMVKSVAELPRRINEAFEIATSGRPGPVLVDLPKDITAGILRRAIPVDSAIPTIPSAASRAAIDLSRKQLNASIRRVADLINIAKKPVIYAGHGVICSERGPALLKELADKASIPVTTSLHGLGAFDELDEKALHMLGMHGSAYANMAMQEADLIIALGGRFDDRVTCAVSKFAPGAKAAAKEGRGGIVQFEIMPKNINKVVQATEAIEGDVGANLELLMPQVEKKTMSDRKAWFDEINEWKRKWPLSDYERTESNGPIKPQTLIEELSKLTADRKDTTYISTGVGQHQMWTAQHFRWRHPRTMITSGGLGTMGYGLPAAIGAKVAKPDALVIDIDGDASFGMTLTELSTAAQFNIGVKVIVLNNEEQGMVTQWQNLFYEDRYSHTHQKNPDFMKLADAMGIQGRRLVKPDEIVDALKWLIESDGPALLEVVTDKKVPVLPMVPTGSALHEFISWDSEKDRIRRELMRERTCGLHG
ncbi:thiamine diphosphate-binding protein [Echria macrotheca]|uniref:Acetolactate synthase n=1 Tax=Echria macrotheca TaxID=438768 RepID=A0AAJ0BJT3_9PEZI|nr:thiamine diphosphate-binding protein [Echria macrotheca]